MALNKFEKIIFLKGFFYLGILTCFSLPKVVFSQEPAEPQKNYIIEKKIETIAEANEETEIDYSTMFDELLFFFDNPLDLNFAEKEQLQQLNLLTDVQINNLLNHISKNGKLISIYELQSVDGFDLQTIQNILPFIKVTDNFNSPHIGFKDLMRNSVNQVIVRETRIVEQMEGFKPASDSLLLANPNSRYLGGPDKLYARYRFNFRTNISAGLTCEKDPGEEFFKGTQKNGFDFYSAHLYFRNFGKLKFLALGDYQVNFGQGLTFWSGLAYRKSADVMNIKKNPLAIRPFVSAMENLFMRGAATTIAIKKFEITGFLSAQRLDASVTRTTDTSGTQEESFLVSVQTSGFHRTPNEVANKNKVGETIAGGHIAYKRENAEFGLSGVQSLWALGLQKKTNAYNQYDFYASANQNLGADYSFIIRNLNFFGEVARSLSGGFAFLNGAIASITPEVSVSILHRNFQRNYNSVYSNAFSESTGTNNEKGLYFGINAKLNSDFTFAGFVDKFEFPWLKYQVNAPSGGTDYLAQLTYKPNKKLEIYTRYRQKTAGINSKDPAAIIDYLADREKQNLRFNSSYKVTEDITLRNRVEFLKYQLGNLKPESGYLIYQDVMFKAHSNPFSFSFRFALFETESYNSRIYAYENEVLYAYSIPAYYYRGVRTYVIFQYKFLRKFDVWLRLGQTYINNKNMISSGLSEIQGNTKTEVKIQMRYKF